MINPAGDTKDPGRILDDSFERGITIQFVQEIKKIIEARYNNIRIILTRIPGESVESLQNANFANRLDVDFYFSVHFFKENSTIPQVFLYHYLNDPFIVQISPNLHFFSFDNLHLINISKTLDCGSKIKKSLEKYNQFDFKGFFGIPFKPLIGIKTPSLALEAGLKNSKDWQNLVQPIVDAIEQIIK